MQPYQRYILKSCSDAYNPTSWMTSVFSSKFFDEEISGIEANIHQWSSSWCHGTMTIKKYWITLEEWSSVAPLVSWYHFISNLMVDVWFSGGLCWYHGTNFILWMIYNWMGGGLLVILGSRFILRSDYISNFTLWIYAEHGCNVREMFWGQITYPITIYQPKNIFQSELCSSVSRKYEKIIFQYLNAIDLFWSIKLPLLWLATESLNVMVFLILLFWNYQCLMMGMEPWYHMS